MEEIVYVRVVYCCCSGYWGDVAVCDMYGGVGNLSDDGLNIVMIVCYYFSEV